LLPFGECLLRYKDTVGILVTFTYVTIMLRRAQQGRPEWFSQETEGIKEEARVMYSPKDLPSLTYFPS
jgi:hypothetical protein